MFTEIIQAAADLPTAAPTNDIGSALQRLLDECLSGTGHIILVDMVDDEVVEGAHFRIGEVNPRPLDFNHQKAIGINLGNRNVYSRKYPMIAGVRKGNILNILNLVGKGYSAMSTMPVVQFPERALELLILLLGGQHRYQAAMDVLQLLVAEYRVKSAALEAFILKTAR